MANITQDSLNIRLQKLICCIGTLGGEIQGMIAVGNNCYKEKLKKLKILIGYLEALECYSLAEETLATATFTFLGTPGTGTGTINFYINGVSISGDFEVIPGTILDNNTALANQINNTQSTYVASIDNDTGNVIITGTCSNFEFSAIIDNNRTGWGIEYTEGIGGICVDNCLTEEQVLAMFDRVSNYCDICFPNAEYNFTDSLISSTPVE